MTREHHRARPLRAAARLAAVLALWGLASSPVLAQDSSPEEIGLGIAREAAARNDGFGNFTANLTMVLRNRQGQESRRQIRFKVLEVEDDGDKSLFVFDQPRDVQGTALLTHGHLAAQDDQWLYLPALKRVKRISSSTRTGSFMGSEFSYEDMSNPEIEKYTYRFLREEPCGDSTCTVNEQVPVDRKSSYSRQVVWQDKDHLRTRMVHYYDRKNSHLKTLVFAGYRQYLDRYWRAGEMTMENHLTGKSTVLNWTDLEFGADLGDSDFSQAALRRVR